MMDMTDDFSSDTNHGMKLRPRRSALSDISNTIAQQFSNVFSKKTNPKKRKSAGANEELDATSSTTVAATQPALTTNISVSESATDLPKESIVSRHEESSTSDALGAMVDNPVFEEVQHKKAKLSITMQHGQQEQHKQVILEPEFVYGFQMPSKLQRKIPLQTRAADPSLCLHIIDDLYAFYSVEQMSGIRDAIHPKSEISTKMRTILVDWILEVHYKYRLNTPTLWLTVYILDAVLAKEPVLRSKIQLVGITALFIACKFEEMCSPEVKDMVYLTDNAYNKEDLLQMESNILTSLDYQLMVPTAYHFLVRYLNRIRATERLRLLAFYTAERNLQECDCVGVLPQVYACAALFVALCTVRLENGVDKDNVVHPSAWTDALREESMGMTVQDFYDVAKTMAMRNNELPAMSTRRKIEAAKKKYATKTMQNVSDVVFPVFQ